MKKLIALLLVILTVCMCTMPVFAAKGVKVVNKKYVSDINSGETFKYKATWGVGKPKLTIKDDHGLLQGRSKLINVEVRNANTGAVVCGGSYRLSGTKTQVVLSLPNKSATYKVRVTVVSNNAPWLGTPSFTATVTRGTLSK